MTLAVALSVVFGIAAGFPLLQWGLRRERETLYRFERCCRWLLVPLLAGAAALLFVLYRPVHAIWVIGMGMMICWIVAGSGRRERVPHTAAALLLAGLVGTEWLVMGSDARGRNWLAPSTRIEIAGRRAVPGFVRSLLSDNRVTHRDVRFAYELYTTDEHRVLPVLVAALHSSLPSDVSDDAEAALLSIGPSVVPPLVEMLLANDQDIRMRVCAAEALGRLGDPRPESMWFAIHDKEPRAVRDRIRDQAVPALIAVLRSGPEDMHGAAAAALDRIGRPAVQTGAR